ncbi:Dynein heavy chain, domain-1, partial [Cinara cedri]
MFLGTLTKPINKIESNGLVESKLELSALWRTLVLIWINCLCFQNFNNIVIFVKCICNTIIAESSRHAEGNSTFQGEPAENIHKINDVLDIISYFKNQFKIVQMEYFSEKFEKFKLKNPVLRNLKPRYWNFRTCDLFERLDAFEERLNCLKSMLLNFIDYQKLEKIEVSGLMSRMYTPMLERVFLRYSKYLELMSSIAYDPLDLFNEEPNKLFRENHNYYVNLSNDIDHRLATLAKSCYENSNDLMTLHKFLLVFGVDLLEKPIIADSVKEHKEKILSLLETELTYQLKILDSMTRTKLTSEVDRNDYYESRFIPEKMDLRYPPVARIIIWGHSQKNRLMENVLSTRSLELPLPQEDIPLENRYLVYPVENENVLYGEEVENEQQPLLTKIEATIKAIHSLTKSVYERLMQIKDNFKKIKILSSQWENTPMYVREKTTKLIMLGDRLTYFKTNRYKEIDNASSKIHQLLKEDLLLFHNVPLVDPNREYDYNDEMDVEIEEEVEEESVKPKLLEEEQEEIIDSVLGESVNETESVYLNEEENAEEEEKQLLNDDQDEEMMFDEMGEEEIKLNYIDTQVEIILSDLGRKLLWEEYKKYVDDAVFVCLQNAILISLKYIHQDLKNVQECTAIFMAMYVLNEKGPIFSPDFNINNSPNFYGIIDSLLEDIVEMGLHMKRIAEDYPPYNVDIREIGEIKESIYSILTQVKITITKALDYIAQYKTYSSVWLTDKNDALSLFLTYGKDLTDDEMNL